MLWLKRVAYPFLFPLGTLCVVGAWLPAWLPRSHPFWSAFRFLPYLVLVVGLLLGLRFNRSRLVYSLGVLAAAEVLLRSFVFGHLLEPRSGFVAAGVGVLLPLALTLLSFKEERGFATRHGLACLLGLLLPPLVLAWAWSRQLSGITGFFTASIIELPSRLTLPLGQPALLSLGLCSLLLLGRALYTLRAMDAAACWAVLTSGLALIRLGDPVHSTFLFTMAGVILLVGLLESSYAMAYSDELTSLPARRALMELLAKQGRQYTIAMVDIDHFKKFNDTYGHDVGDQVLRMTARHLAAVGGGGAAFRYGGEEFTIVFPGKAREEAEEALEQLRQAIADATFTLRGPGRPTKKGGRGKAARAPGARKLSVTVSIGAANRDSASRAPLQVLKAADQALYKAKQAGRNQVMLA